MCRSVASVLVAVCLIAVVAPQLSIPDEPPPARDRAIRFEGLGAHRRMVSTRSPEAQDFFNQGLAFLYGFNHAEAIHSFEHAAKLDPECAMAWWAIALANGPHINYPVVDEPHAKAAWSALGRARKLAEKAPPVERDLIEAVTVRYADPQPEDRKPLDEAYANAMRKLWAKYPEDGDIGALFAESLMDLRPWDLWSADGKPLPGTEEILTTLERVLVVSPHHPLGLHLYIHAVEASPNPEKASAFADRLRDLQPGLGHMVHMPSHIDVRLGQWQQAILANEKAIKADATYRRKVPEQDFYRTYMAHNHHMLAFAAMMQGQSQRSTEAIANLLAEIPPEWLKDHALFVDAYFAMPYELHLRFGRWEEMLAEPEPAEILPVARAVRFYARGVAYAALKQVAEAREEQKKFLAARAALPEESVFVLNTAADVLGVAEQILEGEILYREGKVDDAIVAMQEAVRREEALRYTEPPDWIQPVRHVLGAALVDSGRFAEAEKVYQRDLQRHPGNGWSLYGLVRCLKMQSKDAESAAAEARFQQAWKHADVKLSSSCYCLPGPK